MKLKDYQTKRALRKENERLRETIAVLEKDLAGKEAEIVGLISRAGIEAFAYKMPRVMVI